MMTQIEISYYDTTSTPSLSLSFGTFWWYLFQNSGTVRNIVLKFGIVIGFEKLEVRMQVFPPGVVHKLRQSMKTLWTNPAGKTCMWSSSFSNPVTISNFKSISLTVAEFWKQYHQRAQKLKLRCCLEVVLYV